MKRAWLGLLFFSLLVLSFAVPAAAQDPNAASEGFVPYWSYDNTPIESVGLYGQSLMLHIPLFSYPQAGNLPDLNIYLQYTNVEYVQEESCDDEDDCWYYTVRYGGDVKFQTSPSLSTDCSVTTPPANACAVVDESGTYHPTANTGSSSAMTIDGSAILVNNSTGAITRPDGVSEHAIYSGYTYTGWVVQDKHGNTITFPPDSFSSVTDSVGREIPYTQAWGPFNLSGLSYGEPECYTAYYPGPPGNSSVPLKACFSVHYFSTYELYWVALDSITLPNGASWSFTYDSGNGNLTQITYPTGGTVTYAWTGDPYYQQQITSRTLYDGSTYKEWQYTAGDGLSGGCGSTTVADPDGNQTVHYFGVVVNDGYDDSCLSPFETETQYYQGSSSSGTLLKTINTAYAAGPNTGYPLFFEGNWLYYYNLAPASVTTTWPDGQVSQICTLYENQNNTPCSTTLTYNSSPVFYACAYGDSTCYGYNAVYPFSSGRPIQVNEYDYGSGSPGSLIRSTVTAYKWESSSAYQTANLMNLPSSVTVYDGSSAFAGETTYAYDETSYEAGSCSPTAPCGDQTTANRYYDGSDYVTSHSGFSSYGKVTSTIDPNVNTTTYTYDSTYHTFLTEIQYPTTGSITHIVYPLYDANTGLLTQMEDQNGQYTYYGYDAVRRLLSVANTDGESETYTYTDSSTPNPYFNYTKKITSGYNFGEIGIMDGLGRAVQTKTAVPATTCSAGYVYVNMGYDGEGRKNFTSNPDCSSSISIGTTNTYDPLNRITTVADPDGNTVSTTYYGNMTSVTDEAGNARRSWTDGVGRMVEVTLPGGSPLLITTPIATVYGFNALDNLIAVTELGTSYSDSTPWRVRSFTYDSLSRLTQSVNPESGTISYTYDGDGNILTKVAPQANQTGSSTTTTTYCYDALNRMTQKRYASSSCPVSSPDVSYVYDGGSLPSGCSVGSFSFTDSLSKPLRTAMCDSAGSEAWRYDDVSGIGTSVTDQRITNSITKTFTNTYNYDGSAYSIAYPNSTIAYGVNVAEQPISAVDSTHSINYVPTSGGALYEPYGALASLPNGSSLVSTFFYNSRLQPCRISVKTSGTAPTSCTSTNYGNVLDFQYSFDLSSVNTPCSTSFGSGANNGNVASITNNIASTRSQNFCYDALNRIAMAQTTSTYGTSTSNCWSELFTIDSWANLNTIAAPSGSYPTNPYGGCTQESGLSVSVNTKNQITSSGFTYDSAGNLTGNGTLSPQYDAENRICSVGGTSCTTGTTYTYDGDGKRLEKSSGTMYWYGLGSAPLLETDGSGNLTNEYISFGGNRIARRDSSSNVFYYFADHLGNSRIIVEDGSPPTVCYDSDFYPYGGERNYTSTCTQNYKFTGKERDSESGLDNFGARYNSSQYGRFMSPDPYNAGADPTNPQSWNMYSYVLNNPLRFIDPTGLSCMNVNGDVAEGDDGNQAYDNEYDCESAGFQWLANGDGSGGGSTPSAEQDVVIRKTVWGVSPDECDLSDALCLMFFTQDQSPFPLRTGKPQAPQTQQGCTPSVFNPSCKPPQQPSCPAVFFNSALNATNLPQAPAGSSPDDAIRAGATALAINHVIENGLVVPLRSSIVRDILTIGEVAAEGAALFPVIYSEAVGFIDEAKAWHSGTCSTIWSK